MEADGFEDWIWRDRREVRAVRPDTGRAVGRQPGPTPVGAPVATPLGAWLVAGSGAMRRWIARLQLGPVAPAGCPLDPVDRRGDWPG
jgi:hypothetical protein